MRLSYINVPWTPMDSDETSENSQVSTASCKLMPLGWATFSMLKLGGIFASSMGVHGTLWYLNLNFINWYCRKGFLTLSKLSAKHQLCTIHTAGTIDGKVHRIRESPSNPRKSIVIPARVIGYSVLTGGVVNRVRCIYVLPAGVVRCQSSLK